MIASSVKVEQRFMPLLRGIGHSGTAKGAGASLNLSQSINWHHHMKDNIEIGNLSEFHIYQNQIMDFKV